MSRKAIFLGACLVVSTMSASAVTGEVGVLHDAGGGLATGATLGASTSSGMGIPAGMSASASYLWQGGFQYSDAAVSSSADSDGDGIPDWQEAAGSRFDPATPTSTSARDSDGDGISDWEEAIAGTNPYDTESLLQVLSIDLYQGEALITWFARGGKTYDILARTNMVGEATGVSTVGTIVAAGGSGPWMQAEAAWTNVAATNAASLFIRVHE